MNRVIKKIAVLGAGVMGSRIAAHFANIGVKVIMLDIAAKEGDKNQFAKKGLENAVKSSPAAFYKKEFSSLISIGNFDDDLPKIKDCEWIVEAVVENIEIKRSLFEKVEKFRSENSIVSSNTSGIPIHQIAEGRSENFQKHFLGTHFFNPPRYLKLLEVIPTPKTDRSIVEFILQYGDLYLGKSTVECKDTPDFIANRIGVFGLLDTMRLMEKYELTIEEVDKLTGTVIGRPKSATFRTTDIVGLDTMIFVANHLYEALPNDEQREIFIVPDFLKKMMENKWLGDKTKQGFYKKVTRSVIPSEARNLSDKETEILVLDLKTFEYRAQKKVSFPSLAMVKPVDDLKQRIKMLASAQDKGAQFLNELTLDVLNYASNRIPEISDDIYKIDKALKGGFGWELGPFEIWDLTGVKNMIGAMEKSSMKIPQWISDFITRHSDPDSSGEESPTFYKHKDGVKYFYDIQKKDYTKVPDADAFIILDNLHGNPAKGGASKVVEKNSEANLIDIGDGVVCLEFQTKMNVIGTGVIAMLNKSLDRVEKDFEGLVIGNQAQNFSAGANLALLLMAITEGELDEIDLMARQFQKVNMRIKYFSKPVVAAPHGLTLGGGCEIVLHTPYVQVSAETYIGLVETGVGLIPGAGGTKEMTLRTMKNIARDAVALPFLRDTFTNIAMAKVSTSAYEAIDLGIIRSTDGISINGDRQIADAKNAVLKMAREGYKAPKPEKVRVLGREGLATVKMSLHLMKEGNYVSGHDVKVATKLGYVMCGGDLSEVTDVSEEYLLALEREAFLSLCGERKTQERIQWMLKTGKALRN